VFRIRPKDFRGLKINSQHAVRRRYRVKKNTKILNKIFTQHTKFIKDTDESQHVVLMEKEITLVLPY
jgi:hypothetical protein